MLAFFPAIASKIRLPATLWRGDTGFRHAAGTTAADVIAYERSQGRLLDLAPELLAILAGLHASALLWVAFKRSHAARYGPPCRVPLDSPAYVIGADGEGGYLVFFADNPATQPVEKITMTTPNDPTYSAVDALREEILADARGLPVIDALREEIRAEASPSDAAPDLIAQRHRDLGARIGALQQDAEAIITLRGGSAANHYQQHREVFDKTQGDLAEAIGKLPDGQPRTALMNEREAQGQEYAAFLAERVGDYKQSLAQDGTAEGLFKEAATRKEIAAMLRGDGSPEKPTAPTGPEQPTAPTERPDGGRYDALRDSEEAARALNAQRESAAAAEPGDGPNPTRPTFGQNIRPEVGVGPGGTVTYTTVKSADHHAQSPREQLAAELAELDAQPDARDAAREITTRQANEESSKRQAAELRAETGETRPEDAASAPSRPQTASEKLAAELKELEAEVAGDAKGRETAKAAPAPSRGMM